MDSNSKASMLAPLVSRVFEMYDRGAITKDALGEMLQFMVELTDTYDEDPSELFSLVTDRCTVCMAKKDPVDIVSWDEDPEGAHAQIADLIQRAYDNCFGDVMLGGTVCTACAAKLNRVSDEVVE